MGRSDLAALQLASTGTISYLPGRESGYLSNGRPLCLDSSLHLDKQEIPGPHKHRHIPLE